MQHYVVIKVSEALFNLDMSFYRKSPQVAREFTFTATESVGFMYAVHVNLGAYILSLIQSIRKEYLSNTSDSTKRGGIKEEEHYRQPSLFLSQRNVCLTRLDLLRCC